MKSHQYFKSITKEMLSYFTISSDLIPQKSAEEEIRSGVSFKGSQLLVLIFAIFIASIGLNLNSIPVIIGAMLISPLMGPIIGIGLSIGIEDYALLKRSLKNITMAIIGSIVASALYFLISPIYEDSSQLLARTTPSIYDVVVGFFGGIAAIISIGCRNKGNILPGVAIATSLMPPLCTVGYGLATWQSQYFFGALYLFFINALFIMFASWIGVKLMGYKKSISKENETERNKYIKFILYAIIGLTIILSSYLTIIMIRKDKFIVMANEFIDKEMVFSNTQILTHKAYIKNGEKHIDVTLIGESLPKDSLQLAMISKLNSFGLEGTILNIKQGFSLSKNEVNKEESLSQLYDIMQNKITQQQSIIDSLKNISSENIRLKRIMSELIPELNILFPSITHSAIAYTQIADNDKNISTDSTYIVFIKADKISNEQKKSIEEYIPLRLKSKNTYVIFNPKEFPWE